ncbi:type II toxin-antitoxin system RelE/ParE family toxin [Caballeronia sp. LZ065]|nr:type II toxin-antitoxin system RelE/ParE family toxin [Caballeronia sp. LZ065]
MLPIRWTLQALDDLDQITDYIAEYNPWAAKTILEVIEAL